MVKADLSKFTVTGTVFEVLSWHIKATNSGIIFNGVTPAQIKSGYDKNAASLGRKPFYHTYLQRHTKEGDYFEETSAGKYAFRRELVDGLPVEDIKEIHNLIEDYWAKSKFAKNKALNDITSLLALDSGEIDVRLHFITERLISTVGHPGQDLEIMAFAILKAYFEALGFSLHRFSTTFANDGGMDYISSDAFYQVTASPTRAKIKSDLTKLPGTPRVFVTTKLPRQLRLEIDDTVLEYLEIDDLTDHFLKWLVNRDRRRSAAAHLQRILEIAYEQYIREL